ncbi:tRNA-specific 2-thiouridylase MnmA [Candidatus Kinetoplastibacterium sorsogonicusi]|uniref:tRNA-specific 2-thiouridylase MnmA n=1 Tax=Candidatus Kinetoplastidibacterium kentomonadis TaxID=1576550 RepID=A0A3Q8ERB8_9PROT|nr:tRNA 2-thiouridine(34) synthase MnmA [Candidatus Kinetoplastibacterium sorsogonicusi]AWD32465.1 tRNA-specific 2-thiouridylase MnmA [Candidatus Kinetoplastibacterium sorsogonicusi]
MLKKVVIGMSGGVDSSVAAWILKEQGYNVLGIFMKNWEDDSSKYCSTRQDFLDAVSVAETIGIDFDVVNFSKEYIDEVFNIFLNEYNQGRTPNPDILCNSTIKFKAFLNYALNIGADYIATGHYARIKKYQENNQIKFNLLKALDQNKDQSYFLCQLNQEQLSKIIFPLGELTKKEVRVLANKIGLHNANKKDSTGLCFIGERPFNEFLGKFIKINKGDIFDIYNNKIGVHNGVSFYTIGQRKGLGIGGSNKYTNDAWYVAKKDIKNNIIYAVQGHNHPWLLSNHLTTKNVSWIAGVLPDINKIYTAKNRYRHKDEECYLSIESEDKFILHFNQPQWAITPGQYAVIYDGEICIGGGTIV